MSRDIASITTMEELRSVIDGIDRELVALLARRVSCIEQAAVIKERLGLPADIPSRVQEVLDKVTEEAGRIGLDPALAEQVWRMLIEWSIALEEKRMKS